MTLILNLKNKYFWLFILGAFLLSTGVALAQSSLSLSVTPTLFQMSAEKGQIWQSQIKVINSNEFPITVYAEPVNFVPRGERGHGRFQPVFEDVTEGATLAEWIGLDRGKPITIAPQQSQVIPFTIAVPDDASPGGHFAAILIGTKPPEGSGQVAVKTSQIVSSLFFLRIEGDVVEEGHIRALSVNKQFVQSPEAELVLRFENRGNVHLQPQGQITIYNMWGKQRGVIPINHQTHFGNVLPQTIRKFEFSWSGETSITDIGRYTAEATLAYGAGSKKFETREVVFWVVPVKPILIGILSLLAFAFFAIWMIKSYVRRMLIHAGLNPDETNIPTRERSGRSKIVYETDVTIKSKRDKVKEVSAPIKFGFDDLRSRLQGIKALGGLLKVLGGFIWSYKLFFIGVIGFMLAGYVVFWFVKDVTVNERDYEVSISNPDEPLSLNAEEVRLQELLGSQLKPPVTREDSPVIEIVNTSQKPGLAAEVAYSLLQAGFAIDKVRADSSRETKRSVVVYDPKDQESAEVIIRLVDGALPSAVPGDARESGDRMVIYLGTDQLE